MSLSLPASTGAPARPLVTIVTPVYNEEASLPAYERAIGDLLTRSGVYRLQVLFVDDGSTDGSWGSIKSICARDARFQGIRLSRNYGAHVAISAGFSVAHGDAITVLACDLQDPPEVILQFLEKWRQGARIVWGKRRSRADGTWRTQASSLFTRLLRRFAMPRGSRFTTGSFLLVDRKVAECFNQFQEHNRITFALVAWTGFEQETVEYDRMPRTTGSSGWNFAQLVKAMYDSFIGFSLVPIRLMTWLGLGVSALTVLLLIYLLVAWATGDVLPGWTSQMLTVSLFFAIQFLLMGILGEYLYRIYAEVVRRPLFFVSEETPGVRRELGDG